MKLEFFNSDKTNITLKMINDEVIIVAQALSWSPKVKLINKKDNPEDFQFYIDTVIDYEKSDEQTFKVRLLEVYAMAYCYPE
jgi:hypothetical protein